MIILGIWDGHDAGAALLIDGKLAAAVNEERLTRRKLEVRFPARSIAECLRLGGVRAADVISVAMSTSDPAKVIGRLLPSTKERYYQVRRRRARPGALSRSITAAKYRITEWAPNPLSRALNGVALRRTLATAGLAADRLRVFDHHYCHAQTAAHGSGFEACAVVTVDGVGDGLSASIWKFEQGNLHPLRSTPASHSLGVFFEHVTRLLNMRELEDEGKVMALADYAAPIADEDNPLMPLVEVRDGRLICRPGSRMMHGPLSRVHWSYPNEQFAYLAQRVVERAIVGLVADAVRLSGLRRVAMAGGVASNIKATRLARRLPDVEALAVFPHMGDGGLALGAALAAASPTGRPALDLSTLALGAEFDDQQIAAAVQRAGLTAQRPASVASAVAARLEQGQVALWFQGRMEYGPRALGQRSVLARPDRPALRDRLNLVLKRRVWYQPFCPSMLASEASRVLADWDGDVSNPHMTMAYAVADRWRDSLSGVINVDGSCRPQLVADDAPGPFADLLRNLRDRIGVGVVLNTSFNIHGEPLVCTPDEAIDVFQRSGADLLAIGPLLLERQPHGA